MRRKHKATASKGHVFPTYIVLLSCVLFFPAAPSESRAGTLPFLRAWQEVESHSPAQEAARLLMEAESEARARAARHWLPRVYLDARSYQTNDPGASFFGLMQQRSLRPTDFSADSISHPRASLYSRATLGLDLPLYEGGARAAQAEALQESLGGRKEEYVQARLDQYSEVAGAYASVAAIEAGLSGLREMQENVQRLQRGYQLGSRANPLGYSGALGMKALGQKLDAVVRQYVAQRQALGARLRELGVSAESWSPEVVPAVSFVDRYLPLPALSKDRSHRLAALHSRAAASERMVKGEKGKLLPLIGVFTEGYGFKGSRDTATGYSAGLYLRWNLFQPTDYGSVREASLRAASAERVAEAAAQGESAEREGLRISLESLRGNLQLLRDSEETLREQSKVTETLFRSGSLNVLQFLEILGRRADLTVQRLEADLAYLRLAGRAFTNERTEIPLEGGREK